MNHVTSRSFAQSRSCRAFQRVRHVCTSIFRPDVPHSPSTTRAARDGICIFSAAHCFVSPPLGSRKGTEAGASSVDGSLVCWNSVLALHLLLYFTFLLPGARPSCLCCRLAEGGGQLAKQRSIRMAKDAKDPPDQSTSSSSSGSSGSYSSGSSRCVLRRLLFSRVDRGLSIGVLGPTTSA